MPKCEDFRRRSTYVFRCSDFWLRVVNHPTAGLPVRIPTFELCRRAVKPYFLSFEDTQLLFDIGCVFTLSYKTAHHNILVVHNGFGAQDEQWKGILCCLVCGIQHRYLVSILRQQLTLALCLIHKQVPLILHVNV
jgi:hypothetical protein